jgi:hypothetical protein
MAINSCRPGHSAGTQLSKQRPNRDPINPVDEGAEPAFAGNAVMEFREPPRKVEMMLAPTDDVVEIVARRDGRTGHQQQHLVERIHHPPGLAFVVQFGEMLQQQAQLRPRHFLVHDQVDDGGMIAAPCRIGAPTESQPPRQHKITPLALLT